MKILQYAFRGVACIVLLLAASSTMAGIQPGDSVKNNDDYGKVFLLKGVDFYNQSDSLKEDSHTNLNKLYERLNKSSHLNMRVVAHVSAQIPEKQQVKLSALRARAIKDYLVEKGIDAERILALGMGAKKPYMDNDPEAPENSRIEVSFKKGGKTMNYGTPYVFENVKFSSMGDTLFASSYPALERFAKRLQQNNKMEIKIIGHAFTSGTDDYDMKLSLNRALTVKNFLVSKGINPLRIVCEGKGNNEPKKGDANDRDRNNRLEVAFKKYAIGEKDAFRKPSRLKNVHFLEAKTEFAPGAKSSIDKLGALLEKKPGLKVTITTYSTETTGKDAVALSYQRSQKIRAYMLDKYDLDKSHIILKEGGYPKMQEKPENLNWVEVQLSK